MDSMPRLGNRSSAQPDHAGNSAAAHWLRLACGLVILVAAMALFAQLAGAVSADAPITELDRQIANWLHLHAHSNQALRSVLLGLTHLHSTPGVMGMTALTCGWLWRIGERRWSLTVLLTIPGGMLLNVVLKQVFVRARPEFEAPILTLSSYSFPSGHTMAATVLYGVLACFMARRAVSRTRAVLAFVLAAGLIASVAFSRMYLGAHYLTDILAAVLEGCGWLALCLSASSSWRWRARRT